MLAGLDKSRAVLAYHRCEVSRARREMYPVLYMYAEIENIF
jgi:hypothetical protein